MDPDPDPRCEVAAKPSAAGAAKALKKLKNGYEWISKPQKVRTVMKITISVGTYFSTCFYLFAACYKNGT